MIGGNYFPKQGFHQAINFFGQVDEGLFYIGRIMILRLMPSMG